MTRCSVVGPVPRGDSHQAGVGAAPAAACEQVAPWFLSPSSPLQRSPAKPLPTERR